MIKETFMEYWDSGVNKYALGLPTDEERQKLIGEGYSHMANGNMEDDKHTPYELWIK